MVERKILALSLMFTMLIIVLGACSPAETQRQHQQSISDTFRMRFLEIVMIPRIVMKRSLVA